VLLIIPCTLVLLWLYNLNLDLEKEAKTFPSEFASISDSLQNALLDPVLRIGLEATKAMLLGEEKVGEAVVERKILIVSSWRSGSTFLGDLLNAFPGTFYYFEPLHYFFTAKDEPTGDEKEQLELLRSLYNCSFSNTSKPFLQHLSKLPFLMKKHNWRLWRNCSGLLEKDEDGVCLRAEYLSAVCPLFPVRLIKTVRLKVDSVEAILQDHIQDLKVILLVRDPRGMFNSRMQQPFARLCRVRPRCWQPKVACNQLTTDLEAARRLSIKFPGSITVLRYEDLSLEPEKMAKLVMNFLDLPWTESMANFIASHTSQEQFLLGRNKSLVKNSFGTIKNSSATALVWKEQMPLQKVKEVEEACMQPFKELGYVNVNGGEDVIVKLADGLWTL